MEELLREAVSLGQVSEAESLLKKGVNPHVVDENGLGLLHTACSVNETRLVALLLKYGADIEAVDETGSTPLHVAYVCHLRRIDCRYAMRSLITTSACSTAF